MNQALYAHMNNKRKMKKKNDCAQGRHWCVRSVILGTQEAEIKVRRQPGQIVEKNLHKKGLVNGSV